MAKKKAEQAEQVYKLRVPQIRILRVLAGAKWPMPKKIIAEQAMVSPSMTANLGMMPGREERSKGDAKYVCYGNKRSLISLGYVRGEDVENDGLVETLYSITDAGLRALADAEDSGGYSA